VFANRTALWLRDDAAI